MINYDLVYRNLKVLVYGFTYGVILPLLLMFIFKDNADATGEG